jgi:hypothetical protein
LFIGEKALDFYYRPKKIEKFLSLAGFPLKISPGGDL